MFNGSELNHAHLNTTALDAVVFKSIEVLNVEHKKAIIICVVDELHKYWFVVHWVDEKALQQH